MAYVANNTDVATAQTRGMPTLFTNLAERLRQYRTYRQTVNELNELSDRELADLGLHRSMIRRLAIEASREH